MKKYILRQLYNAYQKEIYLYLYALCKNKDLAEDLMQETFMKAILSLGNDHTNMRAWLYMVARNLYFSHRKKESRNIPLDNIEDSFNELSFDMLERVITDERKRLLFKALQQLSDLKREILTMQYYGDLSQKEIAALLKLTPENVRDEVLVDGNGYGEYDVNILQSSSFTGEFTNLAGKIERGKMILYDANLMKRPNGNAFVPNCPELKSLSISEGAAGSYNDAIEKLQNLDEHEYYLAYVTLDEIKRYPKFVDWCKAAEVNPVWCAICLKNDNGYYLNEGAIGFISSSSCRELNYDKDTYPYLSWYDASTTTGEEQEWVVSENVMTTHVISMFKYMAKQTAFNKMIESGYSADFYSDIADNVQKNGLNIYGFAVVAQKSTLLKISKVDDVEYIYTKRMQ